MFFVSKIKIKNAITNAGIGKIKAARTHWTSGKFVDDR
jgi:hypothetical protein